MIKNSNDNTLEKKQRKEKNSSKCALGYAIGKKDPNVEKKEGTCPLSKGLRQQRIKYQRIKRTYEKLLDWWFSNLAEIENHQLLENHQYF